MKLKNSKMDSIGLLKMKYGDQKPFCWKGCEGKLGKWCHISSKFCYKKTPNKFSSLFLKIIPLDGYTTNEIINPEIYSLFISIARGGKGMK